MFFFFFEFQLNQLVVFDGFFFFFFFEGVVFGGCIRDLEFNFRIYQKLIGVLI